MDEGATWGDLAEDGDWGGYEEESGTLDLLPLEEQTTDPRTGITTTISWKWNSRRQKVKCVQKTKLVTKKVRTSKTVQRRRRLAKFGACKGQGPGPEKGITYHDKEVYVEDSESAMGREAEEQMKLIRQLRQGKSRREDPDRPKEGPARQIYDHRKRMAAGEAAAEPEESAEVAAARAEIAAKQAAGKYVPRHLIDPTKRAQIRSMGDWDDNPVLKVSNLSLDTTQDDLKDLFRAAVGYPPKIRLARDRITQESRGYAFVTFTRKEDAERALKKLLGHRYGHMILHLEWGRTLAERARQQQKELEAMTKGTGARGTSFKDQLAAARGTTVQAINPLAATGKL